ncbi:MAG: hypothetical protein FWH41_07900 [Treponema sp.]|nr:hypothetical protein [Treponema sp.]
MKKFCFLTVGIGVLLCASCVSNSYHVQLFTGDDIVLVSDTYTKQVKDNASLVKELPAIFTGYSLESALAKASAEGFTKILSIETQGWDFLGIFPVRKVIIRAAGKNTEGTAEPKSATETQEEGIVFEEETTVDGAVAE